uniref:KIB1-4 beta-propeller domain-containing protein n=1 Tax=Aegilops tauschii subsp. strangulata TaxID=200361 RepID=A0A453QWB4_AEGTS
MSSGSSQMAFSWALRHWSARSARLKTGPDRIFCGLYIWARNVMFFYRAWTVQSGPERAMSGPQSLLVTSRLTTDIAHQETYQCCEIPLFPTSHGKNFSPRPLERFCFRGASYGHLIFSRNRSCVVFDVFTGASISAPKLPVFKDIELLYGALTAPLASSNSHLIVDTGSRNLFWRVGSHSWTGRSPDDGPIKQIVIFKGWVYGMDSNRRIFKVHLAPKINIQELLVMESSMISKWQLSNTWLVACGDMLLLVGFQGPLAV